MKSSRAFIWTFLVLFIIGVAVFVVGLHSIQVRKEQEAARRAQVLVEARRDCERTVRFRDDSRSMWLYLAAKTPKSNRDRAPFIANLNRLIPPLKCDERNNPVPVNQPEE